MKKKGIIFSGCLLCFFMGHAQDMLLTASIQFEVKKNVHKTMGKDSWSEKMKEKTSKFSVKYFDFTFSDNKSIYKYIKTDEKATIPEYLNDGSEENIWYADYKTAASVTRHTVFQNSYLIKDSLLKIKWFIGNENRVIAGFNCRKATGIIFDSVYVFAFYAEDIMVSGGPVGISGLPGMILGLTIPRFYTSYMAVSVQAVGVNSGQIVPPGKGKVTTVNQIRTLINEKAREWRYDATAEAQFFWKALL